VVTAADRIVALEAEVERLQAEWDKCRAITNTVMSETAHLRKRVVWVQESRDKWRERALTAERRLAGPLEAPDEAMAALSTFAADSEGAEPLSQESVQEALSEAALWLEDAKHLRAACYELGKASDRVLAQIKHDRAKALTALKTAVERARAQAPAIFGDENPPRDG
jgi:hypothetical protein